MCPELLHHLAVLEGGLSLHQCIQSCALPHLLGQIFCRHLRGYIYEELKGLGIKPGEV